MDGHCLVQGGRSRTEPNDDCLLLLGCLCVGARLVCRGLIIIALSHTLHNTTPFVVVMTMTMTPHSTLGSDAQCGVFVGPYGPYVRDLLQGMYLSCGGPDAYSGERGGVIACRGCGRDWHTHARSPASSFPLSLSFSQNLFHAPPPPKPSPPTHPPLSFPCPLSPPGEPTDAALLANEGAARAFYQDLWGDDDQAFLKTAAEV